MRKYVTQSTKEPKISVAAAGDILVGVDRVRALNV
jgi:hypothetical protein